MIANFLKEEDNRWYIVLPDYPGPKADLEMVLGADTLLDIIAQDANEVNVNIDLNPFNDFKYCLSKKQDTPDIGGALYYASTFYDDGNIIFKDFEVWLCDVTRFVFDGNLPENIWIG